VNDQSFAYAGIVPTGWSSRRMPRALAGWSQSCWSAWARSSTDRSSGSWWNDGRSGRTGA